MKIRFTNKYGSWNAAKSGKGKFSIRMIAEWRKHGIEVTDDLDARVDIDLQITRFAYKPRHAHKVVLRVGPVEYDTNMRTTYKEKNAIMANDQQHCDGLVYQSAFAEKAQRKMVWNCNKPTRIIFNGADPEFYAGLEPWPTTYKVNFLASTREWVWEKRLTDLIAAFLEANVPSSCLWVLGQVWEAPKRFPPFQKDWQKRFAYPDIRFMGPRDDKTIGMFYRMATCMLHAVYIDACPNAVVEAVCAGCPVLATRIGGQAELPIIPVDTDPLWDFRPRDRRKPPPLDIKAFAEAMRVLGQNAPVKPNSSIVEIKDVAKQYIEFFQEVLA
jgi:glycosyltransferase involved in cell wall biosynthesis